MKHTYTIVIPAHNEAGGIGHVLDEVLALPGKPEVIVVDDASTDHTAEVVARYPVTLLRNIQNFGYGYSLKRGIRKATRDHIVIIDGDGSYPVSAIPRLIETYEKGYDMVVGTRQGVFYRGTRIKQLSRMVFRWLSEYTTGRTIPDINSGLRIFRRDLVLRFFNTLSSGFSFTTTITLAFMLNAHSVHYMPIEYHKRKGSSKVRYGRDALRAAQLIVEAIVFYNPLKIFILCAVGAIVCGIISAIIAIFAPVWALVFLISTAAAIMAMSIGFVAIFLKYLFTGLRSSLEEHAGDTNAAKV